jgi:predicted DNA-binding protein (MmcQ/YjbR family)
VNKLTIAPERLERLRAICLALPEAVEKVAWGDPTWRVRDRIFAMQKGNHEGGRPSLWLKGAVGAQAMLVESDPVQFFVPPYVGHKGWIGLYLDGARVQWGMVRELITESYQLIAPARLTRNAAPGAPLQVALSPPTRSSGPRARVRTRLKPGGR